MQAEILVAAVALAWTIGVCVAAITIYEYARRLWRTPVDTVLRRIPEYAQIDRELRADDRQAALDVAWRAHQRSQTMPPTRGRRAARAVCGVALGSMLREVGRPEEALIYLRPAEAFLRKACRREPKTFTVLLAKALHEQAAIHQVLDDHEAAFRRAGEAVQLHLRFGHDRMEMPTYRHALAQWGRLLGADGQQAEAVAATKDALQLARSAEIRDDELAATCLTQLARLARLAKTPELAPAAAKEAVDLLRRLGATSVGRRAALVHALSEYRDALSTLHRHAEALDAARESVEVTRSLAEELPDRFLPELQDRLVRQAGLLTLTGSPHQAMPLLDEAVELAQRIHQAADARDGMLARTAAIRAQALDATTGRPQHAR
jgi:hypothetical protein